MKLYIKESIVSGRIEDTDERCKMEPNGFWTADGRRVTSYVRVDKEIEYDRDGNPVKRQYSMDRQHRFWIETEDRVNITESITLKHDKSTHFSDSNDLDYHYYDIMQDDMRVGTIEILDCFNDDNDICYVDRIDIDEEYRGQGIGTKVLTELLKDLGYWKIVVAPDNPNAKRLYQRIGRDLEDCYLDTENDFGYNDQGYGIFVI